MGASTLLVPVRPGGAALRPGLWPSRMWALWQCDFTLILGKLPAFLCTERRTLPTSAVSSVQHPGHAPHSSGSEHHGRSFPSTCEWAGRSFASLKSINPTYPWRAAREPRCSAGFPPGRAGKASGKRREDDGRSPVPMGLVSVPVPGRAAGQELR